MIWIHSAFFCVFSLLAISNEEIAIRVSTPSKEIEFGKAFPLTITRVWSRDLQPEPWQDPIAENLQLRLEKLDRLEKDSQIQEIREFRGYAFAVGEIVLPAVVFKARSGDIEKEAKSEELHFEVKSALPSESAGSVELPGELLAEPFPWMFWSAVAGGILIVCALLVWFWRSRRHRELPIQVAPIPRIPPLQRALERLAKLRQRRAQSAEEIQDYYVEATSLIREYIEESFGVRAPEMTTEEFLNSSQTSQALQTVEQSMLREFLHHCDLVKFARQPSSPTDREKLLSTMERFLREAKPISSNELRLLGEVTQ